MKLFVASDIHGSAYYCEQLFDRFEKEACERILLLGDLLYHGPRNDLPKGYDPKRVIELLNNYQDKIMAVRGNCDAEVDQMVLNFPIMADYALLNNDGIDIFMTHGHLYNLDKLPLIDHPYILLHGHTHVPVIEKKDNCTYINPGSVSIPKENSHHGYLIIDGHKFTFKDLQGNIIEEYIY